MSITSTRKVSGSQATPTRKSYYSSGESGESFVENIDTNNNVSVNSDNMDHNKDSREPPFQKRPSPEDNPTLSSSQTYIPNAIEALTASGVYEAEQSNTEKANSTSQNIGVYDNNQSMLQQNRSPEQTHNYLKHFYERNKIIEDVDELV